MLTRCIQFISVPRISNVSTRYYLAVCRWCGAPNMRQAKIYGTIVFRWKAWQINRFTEAYWMEPLKIHISRIQIYTVLKIIWEDFQMRWAEHVQQSLDTNTRTRISRGEPSEECWKYMQWMETPFNLPSMRMAAMARDLQYWRDIDIVICVFAMLLFS